LKKIPAKYYLYTAILLLIFPALLINLGLLPLSADEATRALVALEMKLSGNFITPTINGDYYFNKPPLYNWILLGFYELGNSYSELIIRLPVVIFLLIFALTIYLGIRKKTGNRVAAISALAFVTCGRILFYDSMLGLIDTGFSLVVFLNFLLIFHLLKKEKYIQLFIFSYLLASLAFLMKGLPAIVFQGITIISSLLFFKKREKIFSGKHLLGIGIFSLIVGGYYFLAWMENPTKEYFHTLMEESTKRTFIEYGPVNTLIHIFAFPFEQAYHLLPWSLLFIYFFDREFYRVIRKNKFLSFLALVFIVNIPVYWLSPETYPRYLFMLYPVMLILLINHHFYLKEKKKELAFIVEWIFFGMIILVIPGLLAGTYFYDFSNEEVTKLVLLLSLIFIIAMANLYRFLKRFRMELLLLTLLGLRIAFNFAIIPQRLEESRTNRQKAQAIQLAKVAQDRAIHLFWLATCSHETSYYISRETGRILYRYRGDLHPNTLYLFDDRDPVRRGEEILFRMETRWQNSPLRLSRFSEIP
jgi:4-amino-4-deoxy-L-arabinose transferase-like glycosyltransferase